MSALSSFTRKLVETGQRFTSSAGFKLTFGLSIVLINDWCHHLSMAEFQPPSTEIR